MNKQVKVLIVDDHPLMAEATSRTLEQIEKVKVVGIAENGEKCLEMVEVFDPDIVFLDFNLPDIFGDELAKVIKLAHPAIHLVIFTGIEFAHLYDHLIELKVSAVISKESSGVVIKNLINILLEGYTILPIPVFHKMRLQGTNAPGSNPLESEEVEIMAMIVQGLTNEQISELIHMSKRTVDNYIRKIYEKLDVKSRTQAVDKFNQYKHILELNRRS